MRPASLHECLPAARLPACRPTCLPALACDSCTAQVPPAHSQGSCPFPARRSAFTCTSWSATWARRSARRGAWCGTRCSDGGVGLGVWRCVGRCRWGQQWGRGQQEKNNDEVQGSGMCCAATSPCACPFTGARPGHPCTPTGGAWRSCEGVWGGHGHAGALRRCCKPGRRVSQMFV